MLAERFPGVACYEDVAQVAPGPRDGGGQLGSTELAPTLVSMDLRYPSNRQLLIWQVFRLSGDYGNPSYIVDDVPMLTANPMSDRLPLISSAAASPARTSPSPDDDEDSPEPLRPLLRVRPHR